MGENSHCSKINGFNSTQGTPLTWVLILLQFKKKFSKTFLFKAALALVRSLLKINFLLL